MDIKSEEYRRSRKVSRFGQALRVGLFALAGAFFMIHGAEKTAEDEKLPENTFLPDTTETAKAARFEEYPSSFDTTGIFRLRAEFSRTQLGRDLLQLADDHQITIAYDSARAEATNNVALYHRDTIRVHPALGETEKIISFAHELWHARQDKVLGSHELALQSLTPKQAWNLRQYTEADAAAFSAYFWADRAEQLGERIPLSFKGPFQVQNEAAWARAMQDEMRGDGLSLDEYRNLALRPAFAGIGGYQQRHLNIAFSHHLPLLSQTLGLERAMKEGNRPGIHFMRAVIRSEGAPVDSAAFEKTLRRFGGLSVSPDAPTSLQSEKVSGEDLLVNYPATPTDPAYSFRNTMLAIDFADSIQTVFTVRRDSLMKEAENLPPVLPFGPQIRFAPPGAGI